MKEYTHMSLFSGIGGLDLAAEWAGFTTVGQCEWADYPTKVLEKHWPDVPRWRDIRTLTGDDFFARTGLRTVDILSGGFPCQPFSVAGKQKGKGDDRYLWPEMLRVIRELAPRWVVGENVPGILRIAAADVVKDLERAGCDVVVFDFEAAAVGAPHRRERIAFVANRNSERKQQPCRQQPESGGRLGDSSKTLADANSRTMWHDGNHVRTPDREIDAPINASLSCGGVASNPEGAGVERFDYKASSVQRERSNWWAAEPDVGRVAHGVPHRVDRLKCLGNAVVPQQFYPIFKAIMEVEKELENDQRSGAGCV